MTRASHCFSPFLETCWSPSRTPELSGRSFPGDMDRWSEAQSSGAHLPSYPLSPRHHTSHMPAHTSVRQMAKYTMCKYVGEGGSSPLTFREKERWHFTANCYITTAKACSWSRLSAPAGTGMDMVYGTSLHLSWNSTGWFWLTSWMLCPFPKKTVLILLLPKFSGFLPQLLWPWGNANYLITNSL